jgi:hypothetical protein
MRLFSCARMVFMSTAQLLLNELNLRTLTYPPPLGHVCQKVPLVLMGGGVEGQACGDP